MKTRKILIVDDEQFILNFLTDLLTTSGYQVLTAKNGENALAVLKNEVPDIIISDVMMPEMDGFTFLNELQKSEKTRTIPFLFLSAKSQVADKIKGLQIGADDYICKPFDQDEFLARIEVRLTKKEELQFSDLSHMNEITGDLKVFSLVDIVQMIKMRKLTGTLQLFFQDENASLLINQGMLAQVKYKKYSPLRAFCALMDISEGSFSFRWSDKLFEQDIQIDTEHFLLEAMKHYDDHHRILTELPSHSEIWNRIPLPEEKNLSTKINRIREMFDGQRTIKEIVEELYERDNLVIIRDLIREGLLVKKEESTHRSSLENTIPDKMIKYSQDLSRLIDLRDGNASIIAIGENKTCLETYISSLSACLGETEEENNSDSDLLSLKKPMINTRYGLHIYGTTHLNQFDFIKKILGIELLGLIFLRTQTESDGAASLYSCYQQANTEGIPSILIFYPETKASAEPEKNKLDDKTVDISIYSLDDKEVVFTTFELLMEKILSLQN